MSETDGVLPPIENAMFLAGATASGKTALGVRLAREMNAEIISLDSIAVYRGMDIGTAKPTAAERGGIPHYLIDVVEPWEEYSIALYLKAAREAARTIRRRGKNVLFVGGTPLWLKGCLRGIFEGPPADSELRAALNRQEDDAPGSLFSRLEEVDPAAAARIHPNDRRRLIRALEVFEKTGRAISDFQKQFDAVPAAEEKTADNLNEKASVKNVEKTAKKAAETANGRFGNRLLILSRPRAELYERINRRVDAMMAAGFLDEVRGLLRLEKPLSKTALAGVGYRELTAVLEGRMEYAAAVEAIKQSTRNFAKRQETWFRSFPEAEILSPDSPFFFNDKGRGAV